MLRLESELVLKSRWVLPERPTSVGFEFRWADLGPALEDTVGSRRRTRRLAAASR